MFNNDNIENKMKNEVDQLVWKSYWFWNVDNGERRTIEISPIDICIMQKRWTFLPLGLHFFYKNAYENT
jgi:hypothetical protein